jgi:hypothetical protein
MFVKAYEIAREYTHPLIVSYRQFDKEVECFIGTYVIINRDGWIITSAHHLTPFSMFQECAKELAQYHGQVREVLEDSMLDPDTRNNKIRRIGTNPKWITDHTIWWGDDRYKVEQFKILPGVDLALGKLDSFDPDSISSYPKFKDPKKLHIGTSLCKLGYSLLQIDSVFDEKSRSFHFPPEIFPLPRFPIEGIYTRDIMSQKGEDGTNEVMFLETSSAGLRGQSGGPTFDVNGTVWSIQIKTIHYPLGFVPKVHKDGRIIEENQFLNLGWGVHPHVLVSFLTKEGIDFELSDQ